MTGAPYPWLADTWSALVQSLDANRLPHALLIAGPRGMGKHALAMAFGARLVCAQHSACGRCPSCAWFAAGSHPDWHMLTPEEGKASLSVDAVRALTAKLALSSLAGGRKVALVEPADLMTLSAANSLLKTLEEPPGDSVIVLLAERPARLPATLLSRCQKHLLRPPAAAQAVAWLNREGGEEDWPTLLGLAGGGPLAALALAAEGFAAHAESLSRDLAGLLTGASDPVAVAARWLKIGPELALDWLQETTCDLIRARFGLGKGDLAHRLGVKSLPAAANQIKLNQLFEHLDQVQIGRRRLETPLNSQLILESLLTPWANGFRSLELSGISTP